MIVEHFVCLPYSIIRLRQFTASKTFEGWMARVSSVTRIRRQRQQLHQDEAEVRLLERKVAKLMASPSSRHGKRRLLELT